MAFRAAWMSESMIEAGGSLCIMRRKAETVEGERRYWLAYWDMVCCWRSVKWEVQRPKLRFGVWMFILECKSLGREVVISGSSNTALRSSESRLSLIGLMIPI